MELTNEVVSLWNTLEKDLKTSIPCFLKNAFQ